MLLRSLRIISFLSSGVLACSSVNAQALYMYIDGPGSCIFETNVSEPSVRAICRWTPPGSSQEWTIVAGDFNSVNSINVNHVAAWDGSTWQTLDKGFDKEAFCATVYDGKLVVGGSFYGTHPDATQGSVDLGFVAVWVHEENEPLNGQWKRLYDDSTAGSEFGVDSNVRGLTVHDGSLFACGDFIRVLNSTGSSDLLYRIGKWTKSNSTWNVGDWDQLSTGLDSVAHSIATHDGAVWVGGDFSAKLGKWTGSNWSTPGLSPSNNVRAVDAADSKLLVGTSGGDIYERVSGSWTTHTNIGGQVNVLSYWLGNIIAGGFISLPNSYGLGILRSGTWTDVDEGPGDIVWDISHNPDCTILIGGTWIATSTNVPTNALGIVQCLADFNRDCAVDFSDYLDFVDMFSIEDPSADVDQDGSITFFDYLDFVQAFSVGC